MNGELNRPNLSRQCDIQCDKIARSSSCHTGGLMARKRGKTWQEQVRIKENGKLVYSESATWPTKQAALGWKARRMEEIKDKGWRNMLAGTTTVKTLMEKTLELNHKAKGKLSRGYEHSVETVAASQLGELTLPELTSAAIVEWALERQAAGNAPATVMHHLAMLLAAINGAKASFNIEANPEPVKTAIARLKKLRVAAPSVRRDQRITDEDLARIMPEFESDQAEIDMATWVRVALALPRRREELCSMLWSNFRGDGTVKLIDTKDPRKYREEIVPVPPAATVLLSGVPRSDARVFPYKPESVSARWQRAVRRAGLPQLRLHDLRHEGISRLFEAGLSIEEVALISGHTSWATLRRYTHLRPQDVTEKLKNARRQGT